MGALIVISSIVIPFALAFGILYYLVVIDRKERQRVYKLKIVK